MKMQSTDKFNFDGSGQGLPLWKWPRPIDGVAAGGSLPSPVPAPQPTDGGHVHDEQ